MGDPRVSSAGRRRIGRAGLAAFCTGLAFGTGALLPATGWAADAYPSQPIRLIVPFSPGGAVDVYARLVAPPLSQMLGTSIVVENRPGASGMIGMEYVARAPADGYTLVLGNVATFAVNPVVYRNIKYDPVKDLTPIVKTAIVNYVLVVNKDVPARDVKELIAYAKAHPGKLTYGSSGIGSAQYMDAELFKARTGTDILHVPYKGTGALIGDLDAGHLDMIFADQGTMMAQVKSGKLRALGVGQLQRSREYPELPTIAEAGDLPGFEAGAWGGLAGPPNLPPAIVERLNKAINDIQAQPDFQKKLSDAGMVGDAGTPQQFKAYIQSEIKKWGEVAKAAHMEMVD
jgi:tripartite-type tricarboxylate transporter receptor subunit TctC